MLETCLTAAEMKAHLLFLRAYNRAEEKLKMFSEKSIYCWKARLQGGSAVITDSYRDQHRLLCGGGTREKLEVFWGEKLTGV